MQPRSLDDRVTLLENKMQGLDERVGRLEMQVTELTDQFVQFREEVRGEFSATRETLRREIRAGDDETRQLMRILHEDLVARIALIDRG